MLYFLAILYFSFTRFFFLLLHSVLFLSSNRLKWVEKCATMAYKCRWQSNDCIISGQMNSVFSRCASNWIETHIRIHAKTKKQQQQKGRTKHAKTIDPKTKALANQARAFFFFFLYSFRLFLKSISFLSIDTLRCKWTNVCAFKCTHIQAHIKKLSVKSTFIDLCCQSHLPVFTSILHAHNIFGLYWSFDARERENTELGVRIIIDV